MCIQHIVYWIRTRQICFPFLLITQTRIIILVSDTHVTNRQQRILQTFLSLSKWSSVLVYDSLWKLSFSDYKKDENYSHADISAWSASSIFYCTSMQKENSCSNHMLNWELLFIWTEAIWPNQWTDRYSWSLDAALLIEEPIESNPYQTDLVIGFYDEQLWIRTMPMYLYDLLKLARMSSHYIIPMNLDLNLCQMLISYFVIIMIFQMKVSAMDMYVFVCLDCNF